MKYFRIFIIFVLLIILVGGFFILFSPKTKGEIFKIVPKEEKYLVYISGAIIKPGVYSVSDNSTIGDIINLAGGTSSDVSLEFINKEINLAQKVKSGDHIYIKFKAENNFVVGSSNSSSSSRININTASIEQLDSLAGIGPSTAQKIVEGRPYSSLEDLLKVDGIGEKTLDDIKNSVVIN